MKLIFLDIDGVLNSVDYMKKQTKVLTSKEAKQFDPIAVSRFNEIIKATDAKVIVSSSWRIGDLKYLIDLFNEVGIIGEVIGETLRLNGCTHPVRISIPRGCEIKEYLNRVFNYPIMEWDMNDNTTKVETYIIIDDDSDMLYEQRNHFIHTNGEVGLIDKDVIDAIKILNR